MTAALRLTTDADATPDPAVWVQLVEAAPLLQLGERQLRRKAEDLERQGLARQGRGKGGNTVWFISRSYHPSLLPGVVGAGHQTPKAFLELPKDKQQRAFLCLACLESFREQKQTRRDAVKGWLPGFLEHWKVHHGLAVSRSALYRWHQEYGGKADLLKLVDHRGGDRKSQGDPAAWQFFRDLYLDANRPSKKRCHDLVAAKAEAEGWSWPSYGTVARLVDRRIPPEVQLLHRDRAKWKAQQQPTIEQDPEAWPAAVLWESDHAQMDLHCRFGNETIRPWFTAWMDWRTRKVVGFVLCPSPNGSTIQAALKNALDDPTNLGGPDTVRIDNGKDYQGVRFHGQSRKWRTEQVLTKGYLDEPKFTGIYGLLDLDVIFTIPRGPNGKSRVERWFKTLHDQFSREFPTYTGRNSVERPETHAAAVKSRRLPSFEAVYAQLREYVAAYNQRTDHAIDDLVDDDGTRLSPSMAMHRWGRQRVLPDPDVIDLVCGADWPGVVTANRQGVTIRPYGVPVSYGAFDTRLTPFKAPRVKDRRELLVSFHPDEPHQIRVWTADTQEFVGVFQENEKGGGLATDRDKAGELIRQKRQYQKSLETVRQERPRDLMSPAERLRFNEKKRRQQLPPSPPEPTSAPRPQRLVQTPLDGHAQKVAAATHRLAAGAEGQGTPPRTTPDIRELVAAAEARDAQPTPLSNATPEESSGGAGVAGRIHVDLSDLTGGEQ
ncbi:MAG: DNA-binding domain-containing protein [Planctomycetota bacterium]